MDYRLSLPFCPKPSTILLLDLNSCFARVEQQANPFLRGEPVVVAAYDTPRGLIISPSVEAKEKGIRLGMSVAEARRLAPDLIALRPDPWKYRSIHLKFRELLATYTDKVEPRSIDEFILDLEGAPALGKGIWQVAREIKERVKEEIGDWLTVSVGIAPNRYLAKVAAGLKKPDGLCQINKDNFKEVYKKLELTDLTGIKERNAARLNSMGIFSVLDFYEAPYWRLKAAFASIVGYYWYVRLRGWEIDDVAFGRRSYGNSFALPLALTNMEELSPILSKLVTKATGRMRKAGSWAKGVHVSVVYKDGSFWHRGQATKEVIFDTRDVYKVAYKILSSSPYRKPVATLAVSCFNLAPACQNQLELFSDIKKKEKLAEAVDSINERWGDFVITPARVLGARDWMPDRIAFGNVKELEEFTLKAS